MRPLYHLGRAAAAGTLGRGRPLTRGDSVETLAARLGKVSASSRVACTCFNGYLKRQLSVRHNRHLLEPTWQPASIRAAPPGTKPAGAPSQSCAHRAGGVRGRRLVRCSPWSVLVSETERLEVLTAFMGSAKVTLDFPVPTVIIASLAMFLSAAELLCGWRSDRRTT